MTASKIFFYLCLFFVAGIFLNSAIKIPQIFVWGILIAGVLIIFVTLFLGKDLIVISGFFILFLVLGILRYQISELEIINNELRKYNDKEEKIVLNGIVSGEPDIRDNHIELTISKIEFLREGVSLPLGGKILIITNRYPEYQYGDKIKIAGKLESPPEFESFNYKNYLLKDGIYSVISWPKIEVLEKNQGSFVYSQILNFKNKLRSIIYQNLSPPQSSILAGMILGDRGAISSDLKNKLNITGLSHIIAISGTHVVILTSILISLLLGLGFWRGQAFYFSIFFILLFVLMTGLQASAIRAGIMGCMFFLAQKLGRSATNSRIIIITCALMLAANPLLLFYDVGFQLSFLAVMGMIYFAPIFQNWLKLALRLLISKGEGFIPEEKFINLRSIIATTFGAQIFTFPIIIYNFGNLPLISPLTNLLVLPIVYWLMLFGFIFPIFGLILSPLGWIFSLPCSFLLGYFLKVTEFFSGVLPAKTIGNVHWVWLLVSYLALGILTRWLNKRQRLKFLNY